VSQTSNWPLAESGERILLPAAMAQEMAGNPLSKACYPLAAGYYPRARGHQMSRPQPEDYLVIYCVDGAASLDIDDSTLTVRRGDLLLLPPGATHRYQADPGQPWTLYWMHLDGADLAPLFALLDPARQRVLPVGLHEPLMADWQALLNLLAGGYTPATLMHAGSLCRAMLTYVAMLAGRPAPHQETINIEAVHQLMQQCLDQRLTLAELARAAGETSPWQFIRRYRAATGQTPMQAFLHRKIARACYLLEVSDLPVAEVASRFGFDDPYYFSRLFRKITGISPARYRKQGRR
jgi:AraC family transcriptional regulator, arabinose operon regulatory protein